MSSTGKTQKINPQKRKVRSVLEPSAPPPLQAGAYPGYLSITRSTSTLPGKDVS